jgi:hypothetical protein
VLWYSFPLIPNTNSQGQAAKLFQFSRNPPQTGLNTQSELLSRGSILEKTFHSLSLRNVPLSAIMICTSSDPLSSTPPLVNTEILEEAVATSEIFRHCALIYLFRVVRGDQVELDGRTRESLDEVVLFSHFPFPIPHSPFHRFLEKIYPRKTF